MYVNLKSQNFDVFFVDVQWIKSIVSHLFKLKTIYEYALVTRYKAPVSKL